MEAKGLEPSNLLTASQALYQLSYAPRRFDDRTSRAVGAISPAGWDEDSEDVAQQCAMPGLTVAAFGALTQKFWT